MLSVCLIKKTNSVFATVEHFPLKKMATLKNYQKVAAVARETQEEHPRNS